MLLTVAICHGSKGAGNGYLVEREKILGFLVTRMSVEILPLEAHTTPFTMA